MGGGRVLLGWGTTKKAFVK